MGTTVDILGIGDCIAAGCPYYTAPEHLQGEGGNKESQLWPWMIETLGLPLTYYNAGLERDTIRKVEGRIENLMIRYSPRMVFLHVGIQDLHHLIPWQEFSGNLENIVAIAQRYNSRLFVNEVLPYKNGSSGNIKYGDVQRLNGQMAEWCREKGILLIRFFDSVECAITKGLRDPYHVSDYIHPSIEGYKALGRMMGEQVKQFIGGM